MAQKTPPIKVNLFSFKTFRSPDKIAFNEIDEFFIQHPDITKSGFNQCPVPAVGDESDTTWIAFLNGFKPASSYREIRAISPELYDFSCLLMQQKKNDSSKEEFKADLPEPLTEEIHFKLWDELFVQTASQKSKTARQATIQMIIAQHYILNRETVFFHH